MFPALVCIRKLSTVLYVMPVRQRESGHREKIMTGLEPDDSESLTKGGKL